MATRGRSPIVSWTTTTIRLQVVILVCWMLLRHGWERMGFRAAEQFGSGSVFLVAFQVLPGASRKYHDQFAANVTGTDFSSGLHQRVEY